jgi:hypothetical protein
MPRCDVCQLWVPTEHGVRIHKTKVHNPLSKTKTKSIKKRSNERSNYDELTLTQTPDAPCRQPEHRATLPCNQPEHLATLPCRQPQGDNPTGPRPSAAAPGHWERGEAWEAALRKELEGRRDLPRHPALADAFAAIQRIPAPAEQAAAVGGDPQGPA